jgi:uncharacterized membrane protein
VSPAALVAVLQVPLAGVLFCVSPAVSRPTLQFGVRIPGDRATMPVVRGVRRAFYWRTAAVAVCCTCATVLLVGRGSWWTVRAIWLAEVLADLGCFGLARNRIAAAKNSGGWFAGRRQVVTADTSWRTSPARFPVRWLLPAAAVIAATAITGVLRYSYLPSGRQVPTPPLGVLGPLIGQLYVTVMWTGLLLLIYRSRPDIDVADPAASARQYRRFLAAVTRAILMMIALIDLTMLLAALRRWHISSMPAVVTILPFLAGLAALMVVAGRAGQGGSRLGGGARPAPAHVAPRDDDRCWKGGLIYVNRDDPAIMVGSRFGVGWTFNFGNRLAWLVVAGIVAGPAGLAVIRAVAGLLRAGSVTGILVRPLPFAGLVWLVFCCLPVPGILVNVPDYRNTTLFAGARWRKTPATSNRAAR